MNAYYQTITLGEDSANPQWIDVNADYANVVLGQNTEDTFAVPADCPKTCIGEEFKLFSFKKEASKIEPRVKYYMDHREEFDLGGCCGCDCHCADCGGACGPCRNEFLMQ